MSGRVLGLRSRTPVGVLVASGLMSVLAALAMGASPVLAATNNVYRSQFTRPETGERPFFPTALAFNASGDVIVWDAEHGVLDEFNSSGSGAPWWNSTVMERQRNRSAQKGSRSTPPATCSQRLWPGSSV